MTTHTTEDDPSHFTATMTRDAEIIRPELIPREWIENTLRERTNHLTRALARLGYTDVKIEATSPGGERLILPS